jgi:acylglycerol lipase
VYEKWSIDWLCWSAIKAAFLIVVLALECAVPPPTISAPVPPPVSQAQELALPLPYSVWPAENKNPWAVLVCIHGLGFHRGSFAALGKRLAAEGITTYAVDVRGFGDLKTEAFDPARTVKDMQIVLNRIRALHSCKPIFLLGESMGGSLALQVAALNPELVEGVVSAVPAAKRRRTATGELKLAASFVAGEIPLDREVFRKSFDQEITADSTATQLRSKLGRREALRYLAVMGRTKQAVKRLTEPTLIVQGYQDRLLDPAGSFALFNRVAAKDKDLVLIGQAQHLIFEEGRFTPHAIDVLLTWLRNKSRSQAICKAEP